MQLAPHVMVILATLRTWCVGGYKCTNAVKNKGIISPQNEFLTSVQTHDHV